MFGAGGDGPRLAGVRQVAELRACVWLRCAETGRAAG